MPPSIQAAPQGLPPRCALILNRGSSSLKFALFTLGPIPRRLWSGAVLQEVIDVLAVLNALRAAFPPKVIHDP